MENDFFLRFIPKNLQFMLDIGADLALLAFFALFVGMIWWACFISADTFYESPYYFQIVMRWLLVSFLLAIVMTFLVVPIWHDRKKSESR